MVSIERRHPHGEERGLGNPVHVLKEQYLEKCARDILIGIRTANASGHLGLDPEAIAELEHGIMQQLGKRIEKTFDETSVDVLTGLCNRRTFFVIMEKIVLPRMREWSSKNNNSSFGSICFLDIDDFKSINTNYGYSGGDSVLKKFCEEMRKRLREDDVFARIGGDEFIIVAGGVSGEVFSSRMAYLRDEVFSRLNLRLLRTGDDGYETVKVSFTYRVETIDQPTLFEETVNRIGRDVLRQKQSRAATP